MHWGFWRRSFKHFYSKNGFDAAMVLAYTTLLSLVPFLAIMMSVLSVSDFFGSFQVHIMEQVIHHLLPTSTPVVEAYLIQFSEQAVALTWPSIAIMVLTVLLLLWKVDQTINLMWALPSERKWWVSLLHYLGVTLLGPILLGASLALSSFLLAAPLLTGVALDQSFLKLLPILINLLGFWCLYLFVPVSVIRKRDAFLVALLATGLIEILKFGFALYVAWFPTFDLIYGAFAAIPLFLVWLYLLWVIVIGCAAVLYQLGVKEGS